MIFFALTIISIIICIFSRTVSGRVLSGFCGANCFSYFLYIINDGYLTELGFLNSRVSADPGIVSPHVITAYFLLALAAFLSFPRHHIVDPATSRQLPIKVPSIFGILLAIYASAVATMIIANIGLDTMMSYRGYGTIKDLNEIYTSDPISKFVASTFRFSIIILIIFSLFSIENKNRKIFFITIPPLFVALIIGIAEASRVVSVYFAVSSICLYLIDKKVSAACLAMLSLIFIAYALEARSHNLLGLSHAPQYLFSAITNSALSVVINISSLLLVTSSTVNSASPASYTVAYKVLSFTPTVDLIDGFQAVKAANEQRVAPHIPFNAFGEAWVFGTPYFILFWSILFYCAHCVNASMKFGKIIFSLLLGAFIIGIIQASQYPLRNSVRYFYALVFLRYAAAFVLKGNKGRKVRRAEARRSRHNSRRVLR